MLYNKFNIFETLDVKFLLYGQSAHRLAYIQPPRTPFGRQKLPQMQISTISIRIVRLIKPLK